MVDFRYEFDRIIKEYGNKYVLLSLNKRKKCTCVNTLYNTANDKCKICHGTGWLNTIDIISGRDVVPSVPETLPGVLKSVNIGELTVPSRQIYVPYNTNVHKGDYIILTKFENNKPVYDKYSQIYKISLVDERPGLNGRIEYKIIYTRQDPINAEIRLSSIADGDYLVLVNEVVMMYGND